MLRYTGHPLFDVGVAAITSFSHKRSPEQLTKKDLQEVAEFMTRNYTLNPMRSFLTVAFPNSGFTQPAFFDQPDKQNTYAQRVLGSYDEPDSLSDELDVFLGGPSSKIPFDVYGAIEPGRAFRQHIPLVTGEDVINFFPYGDAGLPVSGLSLLAIQAFPLGSAKCAGKLLAVHSDNPHIMQHFARKFVESNLRSISLAQTQGSSKMPENKQAMRTLLIETLMQANEMQAVSMGDEEPFSITAYHLSNSGQQPSLDIYHLPLEVIDFLRTAWSDRYAHEWQPIVLSAWERAPEKNTKKSPGEFIPRKNYLYEDLFRLPETAARFIRVYFLRSSLRWAREAGDPRKSYSFAQEYHIVSWKITELFLERILNMDKERIKKIRDLGDGLAEYVHIQNDKRFFRAFYMENKYEYFRNALVKANLAYARQGHPPIITLDTYLGIFEEGEEFARLDWKLARDLVLIRMVERLYTLKWLQSNQDALPEEALTEESAEEQG